MREVDRWKERDRERLGEKQEGMKEGGEERGKMERKEADREGKSRKEKEEKLPSACSLPKKLATVHARQWLKLHGRDSAQVSHTTGRKPYT